MYLQEEFATLRCLCLVNDELRDCLLRYAHIVLQLCGKGKLSRKFLLPESLCSDFFSSEIHSV